MSARSVRADRWRATWGAKRLNLLERALADPELVSLRSELAMIDQQMIDLLEKAKQGETPRRWAEVDDIATAMEAASTDPDTLSTLVTRLRKVLAREVEAQECWAQQAKLIDLRRRVADVERKYEELHQLLIPAAQVALYFDDLFAAIETIIESQDVRLALMQEVAARLNREDRSLAGRTPLFLPAPVAFPAEPPRVVAVVPGPALDAQALEQASGVS